ncbi:uncharacterized protein [Cicer arietinum]|uniref:Uncharacterized protein LOC101514492 n=1 Tax=Cicer arietinum TaxID=3827 RepID=A0A1S2YKA3_CICAR|nr:uncharacterized protein LOC101514492 [Cicer arietinum]
MLDPYFMHPSDNPGLALVSPPLNNTNFHTWSRAMLVALHSKNKSEFVLGTLNRPPDSDRLSIAWDRCNTMVMSWITNSLDSRIAQSIMWMESATDIWKEFKYRYHQGDVFCISNLLEEIYVPHQGDSTITNYFTTLKKFWKELDNFCPLPTCSCNPKCSCNLLPKIRAYRDNDYVIRFLKDLNEQYSLVQSQIMLMDPLPNIIKVFFMLIQQERQFFSPSEEIKYVAAIYNYGCGFGCGSTPNGGHNFGGCGRGYKVCIHCNKTCHTIDVCFKKHGYPPNYPRSYYATSNNCSSANQHPNIDDHVDEDDNSIVDDGS